MDETEIRQAPGPDLSPLTSNGLLFHYLDVLPRHGTYCANHMADNVRKHVITTNNGKKKRTVYEPSEVLSWVQNRIREGMLMKIHQPECVSGFVPGRGIVYNAKRHIGSRTVVNIDLKDFFPSITPPRVYAMLRSVFRLQISPAMMLTNIMTFEGHLCQGFVTSPDVANILCWRLDKRVSALAAKLDLRYSRYADDLTFSGSDWHGSVDKFIDIVRTIVSEEGFKVNNEKIAIMRRGRRQTVTGVVVSDNGIGLRASKRDILRAACHHWPQQSEERKRQIRGWISYVSSINKAHAEELEAMIAKAPEQWSKDVNNSADFSAEIGRK